MRRFKIRNGMRFGLRNVERSSFIALALTLGLGIAQGAGALPGDVTTIAGTGVAGSTDGTVGIAQLNFPFGVAVDAAGDIFIAEQRNHNIRRVSGGFVTTVAGSGTFGSADGLGVSAQFNLPLGIVADGAGNLFVADRNNHRIRKIDSTGLVTTFAGSGAAGSVDGLGVSAEFNLPSGIAIDGAGNLFIADTNNHKIRKIDTGGNVTTIAGTGTLGFADGLANVAQFNSPFGVAVDGAGNFFIADTNNQRIRKLDTGGNVTTIAGTGIPGFADGLANVAQFNAPFGVAVDGAGNVFIADTNNQRIRKLDTGGNVTTVAGTGHFGFLDGPGVSAQFFAPTGLAIDAAGNIFVADRANHRIRMIETFDTTAPTVTVASLTTNDSTPALSGTVDDASASISVTVDGQTNAATNNGSTWSLADGTLTTLAPGTYDVAVTATDPASNVGSDATTDELTIASSGPGNGGVITINLLPGNIFPGDRLELTAPAGGSGYVWNVDGAPLSENAPRVTGTTSQVLVIDPVQAGDAGNYTAAYEDGIGKNIVETAAFTIIVQGMAGLPAAYQWALGLLALALLLAGVAVVKYPRLASNRKH